MVGLCDFQNLDVAVFNEVSSEGYVKVIPGSEIGQCAGSRGVLGEGRYWEDGRPSF